MLIFSQPHSKGIALREKEIAMKHQATMMETIKSSYLVVILAILGVFAFVSAVLIAWPALSYLGARLFN